MPQAMAVLNEMLKSEISNKDKLATALDFDKVIGLKLIEAKQNKVEMPANVKKIVDERETARKDKDWAKSDELRDKIKDLGYEVKDSSTGPQISKI
jgi:cysteinyl-tRNA synthetase